MIISHSKQFTFLKSPKTASTSTEKLLQTACNGEDIIGWRGPPPKPEGTEYYNHMTALQIKAKMSEMIGIHIINLVMLEILGTE